jgi:hypothetical protein
LKAGSILPARSAATSANKFLQHWQPYRRDCATASVERGGARGGGAAAYWAVVAPRIWRSWYLHVHHTDMHCIFDAFLANMFASFIQITPILLFSGAKVVSQSLQDSYGMAPSTTDISGTGLVVNGIYGFCDIRNFTDLTEVSLRVPCTVTNVLTPLHKGLWSKNSIA